MGIFGMLLNIAGCADKTLERADSTYYMAKMTQAERQKYIGDYLYEQYGERCDISEVDRKIVNSFESEEYYFAVATTSSGENVPVWISENGKLFDTMFMLALQDEIHDYYDRLVSDYFSEYKMTTYSELTAKPSRTWNASDDIEGLLKDEAVFSYIRIFIQKSEKKSSAEYDQLAKDIGICKGELWIYECEKLDEMDINKIDLLSFDYNVSLK